MWRKPDLFLWFENGLHRPFNAYNLNVAIMEAHAINDEHRQKGKPLIMAVQLAENDVPGKVIAEIPS